MFPKESASVDFFFSSYMLSNIIRTHIVNFPRCQTATYFCHGQAIPTPYVPRLPRLFKTFGGWKSHLLLWNYIESHLRLFLAANPKRMKRHEIVNLSGWSWGVISQRDLQPHIYMPTFFIFFVQKHCKLVKLQPMHLHVERLIYVFIKKYWINASLSLALSFSLLAFPSKKSQFIEYSARQKNTSKRISPLVQIRRAGLQFDF